MLTLTVIQGPDKGRRFDLPDNEPQQIGRSSESLPLSDQTISRRHAELTPDEGKWYILDLNSANGTYVNGVRVTERRLLAAGDQIRTGMSLFLFGEEPDKPRVPSPVKMARKDQVEVAVERIAASNDDSMIMAVPNPTEAAAMQLRAVYEVTALVGSVTDRQQLLEKVMDIIFEYFQADRGFMLMMDDPKERPDPTVVRYRVPPTKKERQITVSRTIVQYVMRKKVGVLTTNAMTDARFSRGDSVQAYGIRSALCVPVKHKDRIYGVIHIDSMVANYTYTEDQLTLLTAIGVQTGVAIANTRLVERRLAGERLAAVGQTVASLSHSIKNILQGLRGGADVVELGLRKDNMNVVRNGWEIVARNLERILELTMNMLAYSKQRQPEVEMTNLPRLLGEVVALVQKQFDAKSVALITDFDADMPPVPLDPGGIHQAVLNLLNNALDAVEPQSGVVSLRCEFDADRQVTRVRVGDNGEGIPASVRARLFEPFHSTKGLRGTGLGLVVTKKIVEEHGGTIVVESNASQGTAFTFELPATEAAPIHSAGETHGPS